MPTLAAIQIGPRKGEPTVALESVRAFAGRGLEGDRFFKASGYEGKLGAGKEVTLIEREALDFVKREHGIELAFSEARRNLLTEGVALNELVGREFSIGAVRLRGVRLCVPCRHLSAMTEKPLVKALDQRGGLNAAILEDGELRVGDRVAVAR